MTTHTDTRKRLSDSNEELAKRLRASATLNPKYWSDVDKRLMLEAADVLEGGSTSEHSTRQGMSEESDSIDQWIQRCREDALERMPKIKMLLHSAKVTPETHAEECLCTCCLEDCIAAILSATSQAESVGSAIAAGSGHHPDRKLGERDGLRLAITWLHERAKGMNDPHATSVLNSAAFDLGIIVRDHKRGTPHLPITPQEVSEDRLREIGMAVMDWARPHLKHDVSFNTLLECLQAALKEKKNG